MKLHKALVEAIPELVKFILEQECPADIALRMRQTRPPFCGNSCL